VVKVLLQKVKSAGELKAGKVERSCVFGVYFYI
jgi:hypothetical protein